MAPGPISRRYALAETVENLEERVERVVDSVVILIDLMKVLTCKVYGGKSDESPQEILNRAHKMVDKWED